MQFGEPLVAACAEAGTDYVDLTGEPRVRGPDVRRAPRDRARSPARGSCTACGFDSIPHDLGAYYTVKQLAAKGPVAVRGVVRAGGIAVRAAPSTRRWASFVPGPRRRARRRKARRAVEPRPEGRSSKAVAGKPHRDKVLGCWLLPLPTIDPHRRGPQRRRARRRTARGSPTPTTPAPRRCGTPPASRSAPAAIVARRPGPAAAQLPAAAGSSRATGPTRPGARSRGSPSTSSARATGGPCTPGSRGGDPGYGETSKMLAESALCLAFDDNPETAGSVTTAQAMGDNLMARLVAAGIRFETL